MLGQQPDIIDLSPDARGAAATVLGQLLDRPPLRGADQPRLCDLGERQPAGMAEDRQIPGVRVLLGAWIREHAAGIAGERGHHRARTLARGKARCAVLDRGDLVAMKRVADCSQDHVGEPQAIPNASLQADQHLHDHQDRQRSQVDLSRLGDTRFPDPPPLLVQVGTRVMGHAPPLVVGCAVADRAVARAGARCHQASRQRRPGLHSRVGHELLQRDRDAPAAELSGMRVAQADSCARRGRSCRLVVRSRTRRARAWPQERNAAPQPGQAMAPANEVAGQKLAGSLTSDDRWSDMIPACRCGCCTWSSDRCSDWSC